MTHALKYTVGIACVAAALALVQAKPVLAKDVSPGASAIKKSEVSKRHKRRTAKTAAPAPARSGWTGPDPTKGPGVEMIRKMQAEGRCIMDEGYGRWTACSDR